MFNGSSNVQSNDNEAMNFGNMENTMSDTIEESSQVTDDSSSSEWDVLSEDNTPYTLNNIKRLLGLYGQLDGYNFEYSSDIENDSSNESEFDSDDSESKVSYNVDNIKKLLGLYNDVESSEFSSESGSTRDESDSEEDTEQRSASSNPTISGVEPTTTHQADSSNSSSNIEPNTENALSENFEKMLNVLENSCQEQEDMNSPFNQGTNEVTSSETEEVLPSQNLETGEARRVAQGKFEQIKEKIENKIQTRCNFVIFHGEENSVNVENLDAFTLESIEKVTHLRTELHSFESSADNLSGSKCFCQIQKKEEEYKKMVLEIVKKRFERRQSLAVVFNTDGTFRIYELDQSDVNWINSMPLLVDERSIIMFLLLAAFLTLALIGIDFN